MSILDKINSSKDIKLLESTELKPLCEEIRQFIIENVSKTGGHLASNLGSVELSVALHRVYDSQRDRIIFDVGHQCYTHKLITGRKAEFPTLRQHGGLSGFPKPNEARDDSFVAGHASTSVSLALGMARARTLKKSDYDVVAVIGDGALTGGLAYEGLVNIGGSDEPLVIILNDNGMSIDGNVGGIAKLLSQERIKPRYINFKRWYRNNLKNFTPLYLANHKLKELLKKTILPVNIFDAMGIYYLGPVDGHDVQQLETVIRWAKEMKTPVLVHAVTTKGKGCAYAEEHPERYHGVGSFDPLTGRLKEPKPDFSWTMGKKLCELAEKNDKIVAITAAMCSGTGLSSFEQSFPQRFFDVGIAEGNAVTMAAGMAKQGIVPVVAVYSSFLQRAYDMLIHDISLLKLHAVFCVDRAGLVGNDGETHHGVFDLSYLCSVPNMTVLAPSSFAELEYMLENAVNTDDGAYAIRYPRGGEGAYTGLSRLSTEVIKEGSELSIIAYGTMINKAIALEEYLSSEGHSVELVKISQLKPLDFEPIMSSLKKTGKLMVFEDVCESGCIGGRILSEAALEGIKLKGTSLSNLGEGIVSQGSVSELEHDCGMDLAALKAKALKLINGE